MSGNTDIDSLVFAHRLFPGNHLGLRSAPFNAVGDDSEKIAMTLRLLGIFILIIASEKNFFALGYTAGGLIWRPNIGNFIPIDNVSTYSVQRQVYLDKVREEETHNFRGEKLTVAYYEEKNLFNFYANNTKISGVCGELWNMLSEYLNFTMIIIRANVSHFGMRQPDGNWDGLMGMLQRNEIQVIPRTAFYVAESQIMDYTTPIWDNRYRLYIRPEYTSDGTWIIHMFSKKVWCSILLLFLFLSVLGYATQRISFRVSGDRNHHHNLHDHLFYTFATICCQGFIPDSLYHRIKILGLSKKIFAWLLLIVLSSHLISYMTNRKLQLPFNDIDSMFNSTTYNIIVFNGSIVYSKFKRLTAKYEFSEKYMNRFFPVQTVERMYQKGCWGKKKYAIFESEDRQRAYGRYVCKLVPTGQVYFSTWITSGVPKGYKYRRALDLGILKLNEFGLTDGMKDRWLESTKMITEPTPFRSININQVSMLFMILCLGMIVALVIFICENIIFMYEYKRQDIYY